MVATNILEAFNAPSVLTYNGTPCIEESFKHISAESVVVEVTVYGPLEGLHYDIAYGTPLHTAIPARGVWVEFFLSGPNNNRDWRPWSFIGMTVENWSVEVKANGGGKYTLTFSLD